MNQKGLSSMVILIITVLVIAIFWELGQYIDNYINTKFSPRPECKTGDPRDCDDRFDVINTDSSGNPIGLGTIGNASEFEIFGWTDDGKP